MQLSPGKKDILVILSRPDICGFDWFWMDLFCIDQTESASISISDQLMSIPRVYKSSRCVKVLLEHPVCDLWHAKAMEVLTKSYCQRPNEHQLLCPPRWFMQGILGATTAVIGRTVVPSATFWEAIERSL